MADNCLYQRLRKEVSYDGGYTFEPTGEYVVGDLLEEDSFECSYLTNYVFEINNIGRETTSSITSGETTLEYPVTSTKNGQPTTYSIVSPSWMSVEKTWSGVSISVQANETGTDRNSRIRLIQNDSGLEIHINVYQASDASLYAFSFIDGEKTKSLSADTDGGSWTYTINSTYQGEPQPFSVTSSPAWLTATLSGNVMTVAMEENEDFDEKDGTIVLTQNTSLKEITISVSQAGVAAIVEYLTFEPMQDDFRFQCNSGVSYSTDKETWTSLPANTNSPYFNSGDTIYLKSNNSTTQYYGCGKFQTFQIFKAYGNPASLIYGDDLVNNYNSMGVHGFYRMFESCNTLIDASGIKFTASGIPSSGCAKMFYNCSQLTSAPNSVGKSSMGTDACSYMFYGCTSLTTAPTLPATTMGQRCYWHMFEGCTGLTSAPELPATTIHNNSYTAMFSGCTSLEIAPELPATWLSFGSYSWMFAGCTSLIVPPELPSIRMTEACYTGMFNGCTSLRTAPLLPATDLVFRCYEDMFSGCTNLNSVTCLSTTIKTGFNTYTGGWVVGVSEYGTFTKNPLMDRADWVTGEDGIPTGWTVQDYNP